MPEQEETSRATTAMRSGTACDTNGKREHELSNGELIRPLARYLGLQNICSVGPCTSLRYRTHLYFIALNFDR
uniref:Uncharacterized protein MANES_08G001600 n=1 Tax=Rhizophora mucronata TaxID=61149 RepID=A0A2P2NQ99_RHIMU